MLSCWHSCVADEGRGDFPLSLDRVNRKARQSQPHATAGPCGRSDMESVREASPSSSDARFATHVNSPRSLLRMPLPPVTHNIAIASPAASRTVQHAVIVRS